MAQARWRSEIVSLLRLAVPIAGVQVSQMLMGVVDTLVAGHISAQDLAAVAMGFSIWMPPSIFGAGIAMATSPIVAHLLGAGARSQIRPALQHGIYTAVIAGLVAMSVILLARLHVAALAPDAQTALIAREYLLGVSWGIPALVLLQVLRSYLEALNLGRPLMVSGIAGLLLNIPANLALAHGWGPLPALGGAGCGYATALVFWAMLLGLSWHILRSRPCRGTQPFRRWRRPRLSLLGEQLRLGLPIGIAISVEGTIFAVIALLVAPLGAAVVAGHQVVLNITSTVFMAPLSMSMALTARTGHALGARNPQLARQRCLLAFGLVSTLAMGSAAAMLLMPQAIAGLFTSSPDVLETATRLLGIAALFQLSDALQVTAAGALRGYKDSRGPLIVSFIAYWGVGLCLGHSLGHGLWGLPALGVDGYWYGLLAGLSIGAILNLGRLIRRHWAGSTIDAAAPESPV